MENRFILNAPRIMVIAGLCCLSAACGDQPSGAADRVAAASEDPPGAARPLSIGGAVAAAGDDTLSVAINCAAALEQTAEKLATMTDNPRSAEIAMIRQAEGYFSEEAQGAADTQAGGAGSSDAAIARRKAEKSGEVTEQAQLAIACLRRYGDAVDGQSGSAL